MASSELARAWHSVVAELRKRGLGAAADLWIDDVRPLELAGETLTLGVPNPLVQDILEQHDGPLRAALSGHLGQPVELGYRLVEAPPSEAAPPASAVTNGDDDGFAPSPLNPRFTFENFVVGPSNRFPHAAAQAVAKAPARTYNPLFIYGGVGLGKTHLMQAIGHAVREANPAANIAYVSGETFLSHFVTSIREGRQAEFRRRYRTVDLWLVDDIQFMASRESTSTEAEFFHTFNALHETNKQIVVSSDRPPKDLLLEDRLRSRFEWGLITDIRPPEIETRLAILQKRAADENLDMPPDVLMYIAHVVRDSVRLLEGSLLRVAATASLTAQSVSLALARDCLQDYSVGEKGPALTVDTIVEAVSRHFGLPVADVRGKSRRADLVLARQIAMYLSRELLSASFADIGTSFNRDHSTVMHACTKIAELLTAADAQVATALERVQGELTDRR